MKTYYTFTAPLDLTKYKPRGHYHWMQEAPGEPYLCVLDSGAEPSPDWTPLPHLLDHATAAGITAYGCSATDTMYQAAQKLAKANPRFHPSR